MKPLKKVKLLPTNNAVAKLQGGGYLKGETVYIPTQSPDYIQQPLIQNEWYQFAQQPAQTAAPAIDKESLSKLEGHSNYVNSEYERIQNAQSKIADYISKNPYAPVPSHLLAETQINMQKVNEGKRDYEYTKESLKTAESKKNLNEYVFIPDKGGFLATNLETGKDEFVSPSTLAANKNKYKTMSYSDLYARRDSEGQYVNNREASTWLQFGKGRELVIQDVDSAFKQLGETGSESDNQVYKEFTSPQGQAELMKYGAGNKNVSNLGQVKSAMESVYLRLGNDAKAQLQSQAYTELLATTNLEGEELHNAAQDRIHQMIAKTAAAKNATFSGSKSTIDYDASLSKARGAGDEEEEKKKDFMHLVATGDAALDWKGVPTMFDKDTGAKIGALETGIPMGSDFDKIMEDAIRMKGLDGKSEFRKLSDLQNVSIRAANGRELNGKDGQGRLLNMEKMRIVSQGNNLKRIPVNPEEYQRMLSEVENYKKMAMNKNIPAENRAQYARAAQILPQTIQYKVYADVKVVGDETVFAKNPLLQVKNSETNRKEDGVSTGGAFGLFGGTTINKETENAFGLKRDETYDDKLEELIGATPLGKDRAVTMPVLVEINNPSFSDPTIRQTYNTELQEIKKNLQKAQQYDMSGKGQSFLKYD
jgi:hypothetical protein